MVHKLVKRLISGALALTLVFNINGFAAVVTDNDGSAFITKAEFDSLKNSFQAQIDSYNQAIDSKIDGAIAAYLAGIQIATVMDLSIKDYGLGISAGVGIDAISWSSNDAFCIGPSWHQSCDSEQWWSQFMTKPGTPLNEIPGDKLRRFEGLKCVAPVARWIGTYGETTIARVDDLHIGFTDWTIRCGDEYNDQNISMFGDHNWNEAAGAGSGTLGTKAFLDSINMSQRPELKKITTRDTQTTYIANSYRIRQVGGLVMFRFNEYVDNLNKTTIAPRSIKTEYYYVLNAGKQGGLRIKQYTGSANFDAYLPKLTLPTKKPEYHTASEANSAQGHTIYRKLIDCNWDTWQDLHCDQCEAYGVKVYFMLPSTAAVDWSGAMGGVLKLSQDMMATKNSSIWISMHYGVHNQSYNCFDEIVHNSIKLTDNQSKTSQYTLKDGLYLTTIKLPSDIMIRGHASHPGYLYLYTADTRSTLGTGNSNILSGTTWKIASHKIEAGDFDFEQSFDQTGEHDLLFMFLPDSTSVEAKITNLKLRAKVEN